MLKSFDFKDTDIIVNYRGCIYIVDNFNMLGGSRAYVLTRHRSLVFTALHRTQNQAEQWALQFINQRHIELQNKMKLGIL